MIGKWIGQALYLLGSGLFAAVGFVLLASEQAFNVEKSETTTFLLIVAFHTFFITISIFGADKQVIASATGRTTCIRLSKGFTLWICAASCFSALCFKLFFDLSLSISGALSAAIFFDSLCIVRQTWLSTQQRAHHVLISNFFRYPLFFLGLYAAGTFSPVHLPALNLLFAGTSAIRFLYLYLTPHRPEESEVIVINPQKEVGIYQIINFLLFRGGQLGAGLTITQEDPIFLASLFFYWKAIDLIDKGFVYVLPATFAVTNSLSTHSRRLSITALSICASLFIVITTNIFDVQPIGLLAFSFALIHAALLLPTNLNVLTHYRSSSYATVFNFGILSLSANAIIMGAVIFLHSFTLALVAWTPACLLTLNILLWLKRPHGAQT